MSTPAAEAQPPDGRPEVIEAVPCANCGAPIALDQRYCLGCGARRVDARSRFLDGLTQGGLAQAAPLLAAPSRPSAPSGPLPGTVVPGTVPASPAPAGRWSGLTVLAALIVVLLAVGVGVLIGHSTDSAKTVTVTVPQAAVATPGAAASEEEAAAVQESPAAGGGEGAEKETLEAPEVVETG